MVNFLLYSNLWVLICALIGVVFSVRGLTKNGPLFFKMVCWAVICAFFARLFHFSVLMLFNEYDMNINMGTMGVFGSILFFLSANYGQIDGLVDDGSRKAIKARIIALIAPLLLIAIYGYYFMIYHELWPLSMLINVGIVVLIVLPCSYFSLKHLIIYDVEGGIVKSMRLFNLLAFIYELMVVAEWITMHMGYFDEYVGSLVVQGIVLLVIVPVAKMGVKKWTI